MKRSEVMLVSLALALTALPVPLPAHGNDGAREILLAQTNEACGSTHPGGHFEPNVGQLKEPSILFYSDRSFFTVDGFYFQVPRNTKSGSPGDGQVGAGSSNEEYYVKLALLGSNDVIPVGTEPEGSRSNYFIGNEPSGWKTDVPNYRGLIYEDVYPNIDLVFREHPLGIKYEFIVRPGGEIDDIRMRYEGADVTKCGNELLLRTPFGSLRDGQFRAYERRAGRDVPVEAQVLLERDTVGYGADYDRSNALIIDPLIYSTYIGGGKDQAGHDVLLDETGNIYLIGNVASLDFPVTPGVYDASLNGIVNIFLMKFDSTGRNLSFSTFIGGSSKEWASAMAFGRSGNVFIAGYTESNDFPTTKGAFDSKLDGPTDGFLVEMNTTGSSLLHSTLLGGSQDDQIADIALKRNGTIVAVGSTSSPDYPVSPGALDPVLDNADGAMTEMDSDLARVLASTFIGGTAWDELSSVQVDEGDNVHLAGSTASADFPTTPGAWDTTLNGADWIDVIVMKVNPNLTSLLFSTYIGGEYEDEAIQSCLGESGEVFIAGRTTSPDFPTSFDAYDTQWNQSQDTFLIKLSADGSSLEHSTFLGGNGPDEPRSLAVDDDGNAYILGLTGSVDFPSTPNALDTSLDWADCYISVMSSGGTSLLYSTLMGGSGDEEPFSFVLDAFGRAVITGVTYSPDFPVTGDAHDRSLNGNSDVFLSKFEFPVPSEPPVLYSKDTERSVQLTWVAPAYLGEPNLTSYVIWRGKESNDLSPMATVGKTLMYTDTDVIAGRTYFYAVAGKNAYGLGHFSSTISVSPGAPPSEPVGFSVRPGDGRVRLEWALPLDTKGFPVTGYSVYRGNHPLSLTLLKGMGNTTEYDDNSVMNEVTYYYAVAAVNMKGEGLRTGTLSCTPCKLPTEPRSFQIIVGDGFAELTWLPPRDDGGQEITGYSIYRGQDESKLALLLDTGDLQYNDTGLTNGQSFYYSVAAATDRGEGLRTAVLKAVPGRVPDAPVLAATPDVGRIRLTWDHPDDGGLPIIGFNIYRGNGSTNLSKIGLATSPAYDDLNVSNAFQYFHAVSAVNSRGEGRTSNVVSATPIGPPGMVENLTVEPGDASVSLSWERPRVEANRVSKYNIYRCRKDNFEALTTPSVDTFFNDTNVTNGVSYQYSVSALTTLFEGERSQPVEVVPLGFPSSPLNVTVKEGYRTVSLSWQEPSYNGGSPIRSYRLFRGSNGSIMAFLAKTCSTSFMDSAVQNGITYTYKIMALNERNEGELAQINAIPGAPPGKPVALQASVKGSRTSLRWEPPTDDGGFGIDEYLVYRGTSRGKMGLVGVVRGPEFNDKDSRPGTQYFYKVSARNSRGEGEPTDEVAITIEGPRDGLHLWSTAGVLMATVVIITVAGVYLMRKRKSS